MLSADILHVLGQHPLGLVFDIDGTLSPIAPTPDEARLYPGTENYLRQASQFARVGILTGRAVEDGARLVNVENLTYIGTHGLEWCEGLPASHPVKLLPEAEPYIKPGQQLLDLAEQQLVPEIPNLIVQRKSIGGTLHYRLVPNPEQARELILSTLREPAHRLNMRLDEGKRAVEILAPLTINKGIALRSFVERFGLRGVIFAGDDRTDLNGILELAHLRQDGIAAHGIVVQHPDTPPALLEHADTVVQGVAAMVELLQDITTNLSNAKSLS
ncbi:trehalose-phosphatase [Dictyobacter arantiisoli]|uniref:Trehalose 6-phosphate phosphatase n=1 Tax=Dictyobacter arantiisoli TaxID=2014874 RepID=A0A5A5T5B9_9CHLR|nr:trehalose-phosphatase [Dictyobacter arantiisoli]GCF06497.1 trehalose-phosphatase [Dictyobacter arantiisoli]